LKRIIVAVTILLLVALLSTHCAKVVSPSGGAKDTIPPTLIRSVPAHSATNFSGKKITLSFNEFVQLKDLNQKLILSPPQKNLPVVKLKGKSLEVVFAEDLMDSTTYTLYFSDAIIDNNEGNKLGNFEFAFSTGPFIDSLTLSGTVIDAFTLEPVDGILVMLYTNFADTMPIKQRPMYVTKTNKEGLFKLINLRSSDYKIFALKDLNSNYLFDQVSESVAFSSTRVSRSQLNWSTQNDSIVDSLHLLKHKPIELKLFTEESRILKLTDYSRPLQRKLAFVFSSPAIGNVTVSLLNSEISEPWYFSEPSTKGDSVTFWITNNQIAAIDSLIAKVEYQITDSLFNLVPTVDTLRFFYAETKPVQKKGMPAETKKFPMKMSGARGNRIKPNQQVNLVFGVPLKELNPKLITLTYAKDSINLEGFTIEKDSLSTRKYNFSYKWEAGKQYKMSIFPEAFINLDGEKNDTTIFKFEVEVPEDFGVINLAVKGVKQNVIVELITEKGKTVEQQVLTSSGTVQFSFIKPENYSFRFIIDGNANGKWDTGYYIEGIQPEKVIYYNEVGKRKVVTIRKNWEYDFTFDLEPYLNN
jgi:hypothetical protein